MGVYTKEKFLKEIQDPASVRRALQKMNGALFHEKQSERLNPDVALAQKVLGLARTSQDPNNRQLALETFDTMAFVKPVLATTPDLTLHVALTSILDPDASVRFTAYHVLSRILKEKDVSPAVVDVAISVFDRYARDFDVRKRYEALHALRLFADRGRGYYAQEILTLADDAANSLNSNIRRAGHVLREAVVEKNPGVSSASLAGDLARSAVADPDSLAREAARETLGRVIGGESAFACVALNEVKSVISDPLAPRHVNYEMRQDEQKVIAVIVQACPDLKSQAGELVQAGVNDPVIEVRFAAKKALRPKEPVRMVSSRRCRTPRC